MRDFVVVGLGFMGGSLAAAIKANKLGRVLGIDTSQSSADTAVDKGLVDEIVSKVPDTADVILLCMPSDLVAEHVVELKDHAALVVDIGSVKGHIVAEVTKQLGALPPRFVPCHPIAGSEKSGPGFANPELLAGRTVVLTPEAATEAHAIAAAQDLWEALGAQTVELTAAEHDRVLAITSHLPHLLAFNFMQSVQDEDLEYAGGGFRDFTRIAAANPELWWRIFQLNRAELLQAIRAFSTNLDDLARAIEQADEKRGLNKIKRAVDRRLRLDGD